MHNGEIKAKYGRSFKENEIVLTKSVAEMVSGISDFLDMRQARLEGRGRLQGKRGMIFEGPSGRGKDVVLEEALRAKGFVESRDPQAEGMDPKKVFFVLNASLDYDTMVETIKKAQSQGSIVVISEMNLLPSAFLEGKLNDVLTGNAQEGFVLFATINSIDFNGREKLSSALQNRVVYQKIGDYVQQELEEIARSVLEGKNANNDDLLYLVNAHAWIRQSIDKKQYRPTSREFIQALRRLGNGEGVEQVVRSVYGSFYLNKMLRGKDLPARDELMKFTEQPLNNIEIMRNIAGMIIPVAMGPVSINIDASDPNQAGGYFQFADRSRGPSITMRARAFERSNWIDTFFHESSHGLFTRDFTAIQLDRKANPLYQDLEDLWHEAAFSRHFPNTNLNTASKQHMRFARIVKEMDLNDLSRWINDPRKPLTPRDLFQYSLLVYAHGLVSREQVAALAEVLEGQFDVNPFTRVLPHLESATDILKFMPTTLEEEEIQFMQYYVLLKIKSMEEDYLSIPFVAKPKVTLSDQEETDEIGKAKEALDRELLEPTSLTLKAKGAAAEPVTTTESLEVKKAKALKDARKLSFKSKEKPKVEIPAFSREELATIGADIGDLLQSDGIDFETMLPELTQEGYVIQTENGVEVNPQFSGLSDEFKKKFPQYSEDQFARIGDALNGASQLGANENLNPDEVSDEPLGEVLMGEFEANAIIDPEGFLQELVQEGYVIQTENGEEVSPQFTGLSDEFKKRHPEYIDAQFDQIDNTLKSAKADSLSNTQTGSIQLRKWSTGIALAVAGFAGGVVLSHATYFYHLVKDHPYISSAVALGALYAIYRMRNHFYEKTVGGTEQQGQGETGYGQGRGVGHGQGQQGSVQGKGRYGKGQGRISQGSGKGIGKGQGKGILRKIRSGMAGKGSGGSGMWETATHSEEDTDTTKPKPLAPSKPVRSDVPIAQEESTWRDEEYKAITAEAEGEIEEAASLFFKTRLNPNKIYGQKGVLDVDRFITDPVNAFVSSGGTKEKVHKELVIINLENNPPIIEKELIFYALKRGFVFTTYAEDWDGGLHYYEGLKTLTQVQQLSRGFRGEAISNNGRSAILKDLEERKQKEEYEVVDFRKLRERVDAIYAYHIFRRITAHPEMNKVNEFLKVSPKIWGYSIETQRDRVKERIPVQVEIVSDGEHQFLKVTPPAHDDQQSAEKLDSLIKEHGSVLHFPYIGDAHSDVEVVDLSNFGHAFLPEACGKLRVLNLQGTTGLSDDKIYGFISKHPNRQLEVTMPDGRIVGFKDLPEKYKFWLSDSERSRVKGILGTMVDLERTIEQVRERFSAEGRLAEFNKIADTFQLFRKGNWLKFNNNLGAMWSQRSVGIRTQTFNNNDGFDTLTLKNGSNTFNLVVEKISKTLKESGEIEFWIQDGSKISINDSSTDFWKGMLGLTDAEQAKFLSTRNMKVLFDITNESKVRVRVSVEEDISNSIPAQTLLDKTVDFAMNSASQKSSGNPAMVGEKGGIDFNSAKMNLDIMNGGHGIEYNFDPAMIQQLQNSPGFTPEVIDIQPMTTSVPMFLGLNDGADKMAAVR